jgi:hypothetical protein
MIGKDITKFSVPGTIILYLKLNEPLSMLHRLGDLTEYSYLLGIYKIKFKIKLFKKKTHVFEWYS